MNICTYMKYALIESNLSLNVLKHQSSKTRPHENPFPASDISLYNKMLK